MSITIVKERPDTADSMQLIEELEAVLSPYYPVESRHGYSVEKLLQQSVTFYVARKDDVAAGCGGVQLYGTEYAEVKRMYVRPDYRGLGIAKLILEKISEHSKQNSINILRLETGIHQEAAMNLYEKMGFQRISRFGDYPDDPLSVFFQKKL